MAGAVSAALFLFGRREKKVENKIVKKKDDGGPRALQKLFSMVKSLL